MARQPKHKSAYFYRRDNFIVTSQIANNLRFISNLQYILSEHPPLSPCCEEELTILSSDGTQPKHKNSYINRCKNFITSSQIANNFRFISNLQYRLSEHPPLSPCYEEDRGCSHLRWRGSPNIKLSTQQFYGHQIANNLRFISNLQ